MSIERVEVVRWKTSDGRAHETESRAIEEERKYFAGKFKKELDGDKRGLGVPLWDIMEALDTSREAILAFYDVQLPEGES